MPRVPILLVAFALACESPAPRRDAGGNHAAPRKEWHVSSTPTLEIGSVDGDETTTLHDVRGVSRSSAGDIIIFNGGSHDVRVYGADGELKSTFGSRGDGPGEFRYVMRMMRVAPDTVMIHDVETRRLTTVVAGIGVTGSRPVPDLDGFNGVALPSGVAVAAAPSKARRGEEGQFALPMVVQGTDLQTGAEDTLLILGEWQVVQKSLGEERLWQPLPFSASPRVFVHGDRVYAIEGMDFEVHVLDARGTLLQTFRDSVAERRPLSRSEFEAGVDRVVAQLSNARARQQARDALTDVVPPTHWPSWDRLLVSTTGDVWVRHFHPDSRRARRWTVFDSAGAVLAEVTTPKSLHVNEVGPDYILGTYLDELEVEYIRMYPLRR